MCYGVWMAINVSLAEIPVGHRFRFRERSFTKLANARTRSRCKDIETGAVYLIAMVAPVEPIRGQPCYASNYLIIIGGVVGTMGLQTPFVNCGDMEHPSLTMSQFRGIEKQRQTITTKMCVLNDAGVAESLRHL